MALRPVIGIEVHVELKTKTKMFSDIAVTFGEQPNSYVNEIDLGYPGSLPSVNEQAIILAIRACHALQMKIDPLLKFDRKNYFYPDLPKGYQITQQEYPIGSNGILTLDDNVKIAITRLHIEEDTAKQIHQDDVSLLDYNRAGIALVEIVSEPVIHDIDVAINYLETLRKTLLHLEVSDVLMSEGSFRCDINVSMQDTTTKLLANRVEVKNLNSLNNVKKALEYEIARQTELINQNTPLSSSETRRYDEATKTTVLMRNKESTVDYKYFPEPNIMPISLSDEWIKEVISNSPETFLTKQQRYLDDYKLNKKEVDVLLQDLLLTKCFDLAVMETDNYKAVLNYLIGDISAYLKQKAVKLDETKLTVKNLVAIINAVENKELSSSQAKTLLLHLLEHNGDVPTTIKKLGLLQVSDEKVIYDLIYPFINDNIDILKDYETRPERVMKFYMGHLMKVTKGQVNPTKAQEIITKIIEEKLKNK